MLFTASLHTRKKKRLTSNGSNLNGVSIDLLLLSSNWRSFNFHKCQEQATGNKVPYSGHVLSKWVVIKQACKTIHFSKHVHFSWWYTYMLFSSLLTFFRGFLLYCKFYYPAKWASIPLRPFILDDLPLNSIWFIFGQMNGGPSEMEATFWCSSICKHVINAMAVLQAINFDKVHRSRLPARPLDQGAKNRHHHVSYSQNGCVRKVWKLVLPLRISSIKSLEASRWWWYKTCNATTTMAAGLSGTIFIKAAAVHFSSPFVCSRRDTLLLL